MPDTHRHVPVALALLLGLLTSSCVIHRTLKRNGKPASGASAPKLLNATRDELSARIDMFYNSLMSFQAQADLTPSVGSVYTGHITEFQGARAIVLYRKPATIRIEGRFLASTVFDMISDGSNFKASLPSKNLFEVGANDAPRTSKNKLENLRPQDFLASMLIMPVDETTEASSLNDFIDEDNAFFVLHFVRKSDNQVVRDVWFDRLDLTIVRQMVWNQPTGELVSDTRYSKWTLYNGVMFPAHIDINRPKDDYGVVLDVTEMKMNIEIPDKSFVLDQPEGSQLREIGTAK